MHSRACPTPIRNPSGGIQGCRVSVSVSVSPSVNLVSEIPGNSPSRSSLVPPFRTSSSAAALLLLARRHPSARPGRSCTVMILVSQGPPHIQGPSLAQKNHHRTTAVDVLKAPPGSLTSWAALYSPGHSIVARAHHTRAQKKRCVCNLSPSRTDHARGPIDRHFVARAGRRGRGKGNNGFSSTAAAKSYSAVHPLLAQWAAPEWGWGFLGPGAMVRSPSLLLGAAGPSPFGCHPIYLTGESDRARGRATTVQRRARK